MTDLSGSKTVSDGSNKLYTPTTEEVRTAFIHGVGGSTWYRGKAEALLKQFDRWLFEMQEDAWDRGYQAGVVDFAIEGSANPYRQGEEHTHTKRSSFGDPYCKTCGIDLEGETE